MALDFFTVVSDGVDAIGVDYVDAGVDPDASTVFAFVDFKPRLPDDMVVWSPELNRGIQLDDVRARFAPEDGILRTIIGEPVDERQRVTVTGDNWTLTYSGQTTTALAQAATAAQVDAALEALSNIGEMEVFVSGTNGGPFDVTFKYALGSTNVVQMTGTNCTITTTREGTLDAGVRLVANTAALDLDELVYDVSFVIPESDRRLAGFAFTAPTTADAVVDLATVTKLPHRSTLGL